MSLAKCRKELLNFLEGEKFSPCHVVVMPDFFMDRVINLPWTLSEFNAEIANVAKHKGGSIDGIFQMDTKGGNSINTASALSSLGVKVTPIICTSNFGLQLIKYHFKDAPIDFSHIKIRDKASITTALEFEGINEKINVMLRDVGSLAEFNPTDLNSRDFELIQKADYVCLFNWAGTLKYGTALAQVVFNRSKQSGRGKTYYDTADPNPNAEKITYFIENVLKTPNVDILSLNENEAITYANLLEPNLKEKNSQLSSSESAMDAARVLSKYFLARIDLHTSLFSASIKGLHEVVVPSFKIKVLRATGAGDAWNAGNILGDNNNLSNECRLLLANAVSACYLSCATGMHPTKEKVANFIRANM
ncbi:MAG: carbohydrate kinase family protein [Crenarchaeota archaeon]|nr:carbohydrate kinase family protein [Thermoproteota archaeon]